MASHSVPASTPLVFTEAEAGILALYDQLLQLQLELALLQSQQDHHASSVPGHDLAATQTRLLEAKATLALRNSVVESVAAVQPTLNAVHHMPQASVVERVLLPTIEQRDVTANKAATICADLQTARRSLADLEVEGLHASRRNTRLASEALQLAEKSHDQNPESVEGGRFKADVAVLEHQMKSSRHRWRVMKGAASAIVAGSGVDWVRDERLRELVLDPLD
ncbi:centromere protein H (CENP-H)-domain-containing protein [Parachaetomium inaequale]|uniref:Centromere protein H (CENP-H)-domain-containing protein n=1 Tax=Parachaetomium inaequale TaxID=2588326 RepID=A0AAN6P998_9PEZI|nr:centromere protein H (CENP-H)-domain-containing protein [Parachaetomium inaequale]